MKTCVWLTLILLIGGSVAAIKLWGQPRQSASKHLPPAEAEQELRRWWNEISPKRRPGPLSESNREWLLKMTTWLPSEWPPTPNTIWTRYAYGLDVTLDGSAGVSAPIARIERRAAESSVVQFVPMNRRVKSIAMHPVRPHGGWKYTTADEAGILDELLRLKAAPNDSKRIAAYYHSWHLGNREIAAQVAPRHRAFFRWLESNSRSQ